MTSLFALQSAFASEKRITLVLGADEWCPYNCTPESEKPGYMVELAQAAVNVIAPEKFSIIYRIMPWKRAIIGAKHGRIAGVIAAVPEEAEGRFFPEHEQGLMYDTFFTVKDSEWTFHSIEQLLKGKITLGGINGYRYSAGISDFLMRYPERRFMSSGPDAVPKLIQLLNLRRIDAYVGNEPVFRHKLGMLGMSFEDYRVAGASNIAEKFYIALYDESHANMISAGTKSLRESGRLKEILSRYNLNDWK